MATNSIGDFFINITPQFDKGKVAGASTALGGIAKGAAGITAGIAAAGAGIHMFTSNVANANFELERNAKLLGITENQLLASRQAFELAGVQGEEFDGLLKNILQSREQILRGEGEFGKAAMQGFNLQALVNPKTAVDEIRKGFLRIKPSQRLDLANILGIGENLIPVLTQSDKQWKENIASGKATADLTQGQLERSRELFRQNQLLSQSYKNLKRDVGGELLGSQANLSAEVRGFLDDPEIRKTLKELTRALSELTSVIVRFLGGTLKGLGEAQKGVSKFKARIGLGSSADEALLATERKKEVKKQAETLFALRRKVKEDGVVTPQESLLLAAQQKRFEGAVSTLERKYDIKVNITGQESDKELADKLNAAFKRVLEPTQERESVIQ